MHYRSFSNPRLAWLSPYIIVTITLLVCIPMEHPTPQKQDSLKQDIEIFIHPTINSYVPIWRKWD